MSTEDKSASRAAGFAAQLEQANADVLATAEACSAEDWRTLCENEGRSAGVLAHHIAVGYEAEQEGLQAVLRGRPLPVIYQNWDKLNQFNAQHAEQHAQCDRAEVLELLRHNGAELVRFIRDLSDVDLGRTAPFPLAGGMMWSVQEWLERVVVPHPLGHLTSIRTALAPGASSTRGVGGI